jgi:hypothetical protein
MVQFLIPKPVRWPRWRDQGRVAAQLPALTGAAGLDLHGNRCDSERQNEMVAKHKLT